MSTAVATFVITLKSQDDAKLLEGISFGNLRLAASDFVRKECAVYDSFAADGSDAWDFANSIHKKVPSAKVYIHLDYLSTGSIEAVCNDGEGSATYVVEDVEGELFGLTVGDEEWLEIVNRIAEEENDEWDEDWEE